MSFSSIAVAQREKEAEALKSFLAFSLVGSLILHVGVLASGIANLLTRVPELEQEPIELTLVEPTALEIPPEQAKPSPEQDSPGGSILSGGGGGGSSGGGSGGIGIQTVPKSQASTSGLTQPHKFVDNSKPTVAKLPEQRIEQPKSPASKPQELTESEKPVEKTTPDFSQRPAPIAANTSKSSVGVEQSSEKLKDLLSGIRDLRASQGSSQSSGNSTGDSNNSAGGSTGSSVALDNGSGNGSGNGTGNGIGNGSGTGKPVATAPTSPKLPENRDRDSNGSANGRAACRECRTKYPEAARRRGIEGRVEVAVDTDYNGNVTNVRIARSSGNRDLDEETLRQAREWKLKPATGGRQGVSIATEFAIQGSRRHREVQERKRQTEAASRNQQAAASDTTSNEDTSRRRRRVVTSTNTENIGETTTENRSRDRRSPTPSVQTTDTRISRRLRLPRTETAPSSANRTSDSQRSLRESLQRRENVANTSQSQSQPTKNRRRRRTQQSTSPSQSKLIESLRRSSQPSLPPASGNNSQ